MSNNTELTKHTDITGPHREIRNKLRDLYEELFRHDGYGELRLEIRILRRGQKEVIISCGKQYRYVVPFLGFRSHDPGVIGKPQEESGGHQGNERRKNASDRRQSTTPYEGMERRKTLRRATDRLKANTDGDSEAK